MMNDAEIIIYKVRLGVWVRRDGRAWLAWCPSIDVTTQEKTKKGVFKALGEAVQLWFEFCIERGVLDKALKEAGFEKVPPDEEVGMGSDSIQIQKLSPDTEVPEFKFSPNHRSVHSSIEGVIPAYMAEHQLGDSVRACR